MAPEYRLMSRRRLPDRAGIDPVVEEDYERAPPKSTNRDRMIPSSRSLHLVSGEIKGIDLRLGQVVAPGYISLLLWVREPWRRIDDFLFPRPGNDGTQVLTSLVSGTTRIDSIIG